MLYFNQCLYKIRLIIRHGYLDLGTNLFDFNNYISKPNMIQKEKKKIKFPY